MPSLGPRVSLFSHVFAVPEAAGGVAGGVLGDVPPPRLVSEELLSRGCFVVVLLFEHSVSAKVRLVYTAA